VTRTTRMVLSDRNSDSAIILVKEVMETKCNRNKSPGDGKRDLSLLLNSYNVGR